MQKTITLLISTIILGAAFCPNTKAMFVEQGANWWSFDEMLEYYHEMESQQEAECHGDFDCNMRFEEEHYENDEKYRAMHGLPERQFLLTAINPSAETIKVYLFGQDMMLKRMGIEERLSPDSFRIGWIENWPSWDFENHVMLEKNTEVDGSNWLPVDTEVEFSVAGSNVIENRAGKLGYSVFAGLFNAQGAFDYESCLSDPDYHAGSECRISFSAERGAKYFPPKSPYIDMEEPVLVQPEEPLLIPEEIIAEGMEEDSLTEKLTTEEDPSTEEPATAVASEAEPTSTSEISTDSNPQTTSGELKAPETGAAPANEEYSFEFPWWLGVLLGINGAILVWLFWPEFTHKK